MNTNKKIINSYLRYRIQTPAAFYRHTRTLGSRLTQTPRDVSIEDQLHANATVWTECDIPGRFRYNYVLL